jgi:hypothetical protein
MVAALNTGLLSARRPSSTRNRHHSRPSPLQNPRRPALRQFLRIPYPTAVALRAGVLTVASLTFSTAVSAHTPLCACYDMGDGTVLCEGGFSDGSSAAGVAIRVVDGNGNPILEGELNEYSEVEFDKPDGDYTVVFDAGPGHDIEISGKDIVE